ncbi:ABC transporter thiamine pyrophosphate-binding lipoprotein p37/Cypl [Mycoplasmopsis agassizii]|nr:hypothetical protein [Mycoplasmopsis agassizii]SMC18591.1 phosphonate transport system substrate-binding protein [Mycoplasmopsis agassizii]
MKLKSKKLLFTSLGIVSLIGVSTAIACSNAEDPNIKKVNLTLGTEWFTQKTGSTAVADFTKTLNSKIKELKEKDTDNKYKDAKIVEVKIASNEEKKASLNDLKAGKSAMTIINVRHAVEEPDIKNVEYLARTETRSFKDDTKQMFYKDEGGPEYLKNTAKWVNDYLKLHPYQTWDDTREKWDGVKWEFLYGDLTTKDGNKNTTPYYRGMVAIVGNDETIEKIKKAWNDKNWQDFYNFGIVHGKTEKQGKYIIQEKLFKDHFGDHATIASIPSGKHKIDDGNTIGTLSGYRIFLDDMYSFAWQHNKDGGTKKNIFNPPQGERIEILTLTNSLFYDIVAFNKDLLNEQERKLLLDAFIALSLEDKDSFGKGSGYNFYRYINDFNKEIKEPYEKAIK